MIFNTNELHTSYITESSPYELGIEGALMHVYENECNYNNLMRAIGISELRYYQDTGKSLFVHEAGAFDKAITKVKQIFESIIAAIVKIFNKFKDTMVRFFASDKQFVDKYKKVLEEKDLSGFEFKGHNFNGLAKALTTNVSQDNYTSAIDIHGSVKPDDIAADIDNVGKEEQVRALTLKLFTNSKIGNSVDTAKFIQELKDNIIGNDNEVVNYSISDALAYISSTKKDIKDADDTKKRMCKVISDYIKALDKYKKDIDKEDNDKDTKIKNINGIIDLQKSISHDLVKVYGIIVGALKQRNRQSKAMCVKALSYKKENTKSGIGESVYDLFSNVVIN